MVEGVNVLVIGSDEKVAAQLAQLDRQAFDIVIGVNRAALDYPPVDYHLSLHPETFAACKAARMVSNKDHRGVDEIYPSLWRIGGNSGSSGLYAVRYALHKLSASLVVLAGVGMEESPHYYSPSYWHAAKKFQKTWLEVLPDLRGRVYSLGGWTAEILNCAFKVVPPVIPVFTPGRDSGHINLKETNHV